MAQQVSCGDRLSEQEGDLQDSTLTRVSVLWRTQIPPEEDQLDCTTAEDKKKTVSVWNEFLNVFEEILGLSPNRVVEFSIDIIPGATPISKALYQMAPTELAIFKEQLLEY